MDKVFTADTVNELLGDPSHAGIAQAGIVFESTTFHAQTGDETAKPLVVGGEAPEGAVSINAKRIGFKNIRGAESVTVVDGAELALVGQSSGSASHVDADGYAGNEFELVEGGGAVTLDRGGLRLGVGVGEESTAGSLSNVTMKNGSKIETENMWVRIDSVKGKGDVSLADTGRMYAGDLDVEGNIDNAGTLSADSLKIANGTLTSTKTLKSSGTITVDASAQLVADGVVAADKIDAKGVVKLGQSISVYTGAAAMQLLEKDHADVAAELDRLEGKTEASTMSVLDRIIAQSMKKNEGTDAEQEGSETSSDASSKDDGSSSASSSSTSMSVPSSRRAAPVLPQDAQAFAAFDAVNRVVSGIEEGASADGHGLWVKLLTGESEFGVRRGSKFEVESDGAVIGSEAKIDPSLKVGAAFSYLDGEIDSGALKNDWKSYGLTAYAHYRAGDFGLKGSAGWLRGTTESDEDLDADVRHAGIRSEYGFDFGPMTVTPFLGGRVMSGSFDGTATQTVVSVPLGAKLSGRLETAGWSITPALEASYVRSMGDTDAEDVRFLPKNAFEGSLSVKAEKGAWTGEFSYRGAVGNDDYEDRAFEVRIGMKF